MTVPNYQGNPSRYKPNGIDDRAIRDVTQNGPQSAAYFAVAVALDALVEDIFDAKIYMALDPQTRKALRSAEKALRRAGFSLIVHATHNPEGGH